VGGGEGGGEANASPELYLPNSNFYFATEYLSRYSDLLRPGPSGVRIKAWARFSAPVHTSPGGHPASYTMDTESFPGVK